MYKSEYPWKECSYDNTCDTPSFIHDIETLSHNAMLFRKKFFPGSCYNCGALSSEEVALSLQRCAGCQLVTYCSKKCQKANWKQHKFICKYFPVENGKSVKVRKVESLMENEGFTMSDLGDWASKMVDATMEISADFNLNKASTGENKLKELQLRVSMLNILRNLPRHCSICFEMRPEMLFNCRCGHVSYCSQKHQLLHFNHWNKTCDIQYGIALANWYVTEHHELRFPEDLLDEANVKYGLNFKKVAQLAKYSNEKWLETIVGLINERLVFPLTIHFALKNLKLGEQKKTLNEIKSLNILIVHKIPMLDPRIWEFFLHQLPNLEKMNLTFLSGDFVLDNKYNHWLPVKRCSDCERKQRVINYKIQPLHYHEYFASDNYVEHDVIIVFCTYREFLLKNNIDKAHNFTTQRNITHSKHTIVILTSTSKDTLETCVKIFHDARPVNVLLPVYKNPLYEFHTNYDFNGVLEMNSHVCCIQRKH